MSVDPFIQAAGNSQSINPYSYIMNNPLAGTDPSGYSSKGEGGGCGTGSHINGYSPGGCTTVYGGKEQQKKEHKPNNGITLVWNIGGVGDSTDLESDSNVKIEFESSLREDNDSNQKYSQETTGTIEPIVGSPIRGFWKSLVRGVTIGIKYGDISSIPSLNANPIDTADIAAYEAQAGLERYAMMFLPGNLARTGTQVIRTSFSSFSSLKRSVGPAGQGNAWHHIVEQTPSNIKKFGAEAIHNIDNIVKVPHGKGQLHQKISGFYSTKQPFTNDQTVRQWVGQKSYQEQYDFGMKVMNRFKGQ